MLGWFSRVITPRISLLVPFLNEEALLPETFRHLRGMLDGAPTAVANDSEVILVDAGSHDASPILANTAASESGWTVVEARLDSPSVGRTLACGLEAARGQTVIFLPADCWLSADALVRLHTHLGAHPGACGGFAKRYDPQPAILGGYAWLQNRFRLRGLRQLVWTNGIFGPRDALRHSGIPQAGFLEDLQLSDTLRGRAGWVALRSEIGVSARRYYPNKIVRRILLNLVILGVYRARLARIDTLRRWYRAV